MNEMFLPLEGVYYGGKLTNINRNGIQIIAYDDGKGKTLRMVGEPCRPMAENGAHANTAQLQLQSNTSALLKEILSTFGTKPYMSYYAHEYQQRIPQTAYRKERIRL